ncbi:MAG: type II secretion system F family protein [Vicinamibacteria bacterium]
MSVSPLFLILAYLTIFASVSFMVYLMLPDFRRRAALARLDAAEGREEVQSPLLKMMQPLLRAVAPWVAHYKLSGYRAAKEKQIAGAGLKDALSTDEFLAWKIVVAILGTLMMAVIFHFARHPLMVVLLAIAFSFLPDFLLRDMVARRQKAIVRALPFSVDLLTLVVEAGLDFSQGLQRVVERGPAGPLADELSLMLREIRLGTTRSEALRSLAKRCGVPEVSSFSAVLIQADRLGASIGTVLRAQADLMRAERFQRAEKAGARASSIVLVPLVIFILPAALLVIVGPVLLRFIYGMG